MTLYHKLCHSSLDVRDLGLVPCSPEPHTLGTDLTGTVRLIHRDGMIFAEHDQCTPIANNFADFLGLLLACRDVRLICNIPLWTRLRFQRELKRQILSTKQKMVMNALRNSFHPPVIEDPYDYVRSLQPQQTAIATNELPAQSVTQGQRKWYAAGIRFHDSGIDLDVCVQIPSQQITSFYDRWENIQPDEEQAMIRHVQNPFALHTQLSAMVNGTNVAVEILNQCHWDPLADNASAAWEAVNRFHVDTEQGWIFLALRLPHRAKKKKAVRSLVLNLQSESVTLPGSHITTPMDDDHITIIQPITGAPLLLTVHSCTAEALDPNFLINPPCHYTRLCYSLEPPQSENAFIIFDPLPNDRLRTPLGDTSPYPDTEFEAAPTSQLVEPDESLPSHIRTAYSSRHYRPHPAVQWHTRFRSKPYPDALLPIIRKI